MSPPSAASPGCRPLLLLAVCCLFGWMACARWPGVLQTLGIADYGRWYLDSSAVLAASDAAGQGLTAGAPNPLDPFLRSHKYSDWWLGLRWLGLTRESNFLVGTAWVAAFALAAWLTARPRRYREALWLAACLLSPPALLAVNRANNDLVIFALLAAGGVAAAGVAWGRQLLGVAALALATGLKFYPAPAFLAFLWTQPVRRRPGVLALAALAAGAALLAVWPQMQRGRFWVETALNTFGAPLLGRELGWPDGVTTLVSASVLLTGAAVLTAGRLTTGLAARGELRERLPAVFGLIVLLACFCAGLSYSYRWIFGWGMAAWLWRRATAPDGTPRERRVAAWTCGLLLLCLWLDAGFYVALNLGRPAGSGLAQKVELLHRWRLWTQPLTWGLMTLFTGWLLEAVLAAVREWWRDRRGDLLVGARSLDGA